MSSAMTELDVVNRALVKLGSQEINSLSDSGKTPRVMRGIVDPVRDKFLRENEWNVSVERTLLTKDTVAPSWGWDNRFPA